MAVVGVINRKALEHWGHNPAPDVAYSLIHHDRRREMVTWAQVMADRRQEQRQRLERKRFVRAWRAHRLMVAYYDQDLMGGWHAFLDDGRGERWGTWVRADWLRESLMALFPLVPDQRNDLARWREWLPAFARRYERRRHNGQPVGVRFVWWTGFGSPRLSTATPAGEAEDGGATPPQAVPRREPEDSQEVT